MKCDFIEMWDLSHSAVFRRPAEEQTKNSMNASDALPYIDSIALILDLL